MSCQAEISPMLHNSGTQTQSDMGKTGWVVLAVACMAVLNAASGARAEEAAEGEQFFGHLVRSLKNPWAHPRPNEEEEAVVDDEAGEPTTAEGGPEVMEAHDGPSVGNVESVGPSDQERGLDTEPLLKEKEKLQKEVDALEDKKNALEKETEGGPPLPKGPEEPQVEKEELQREAEEKAEGAVAQSVESANKPENTEGSEEEDAQQIKEDLTNEGAEAGSETQKQIATATPTGGKNEDGDAEAAEQQEHTQPTHDVVLRKVKPVRGPFPIQHPEAWSKHELGSLDATLNGLVNVRENNLQDQIDALRDAVEGMIGHHPAGHYGECGQDSDCREGTFCAILGKEEEAAQMVGHCLKKYENFCRNNADCPGDDLFCEMDSETAYGKCSPKVEVFSFDEGSPLHKESPATKGSLLDLQLEEAEAESFAKPEEIDLGLAPESADHPDRVEMPLADLAEKPVNESSESDKNEQREVRALRSAGEKREALLAAKSCELRTWKTCGFDATNLNTNCDDPTVRDSAPYQDHEHRRLMVNVVFHVQGPSLEKPMDRAAHRREALKLIKETIATMAADFGPHGIYFAPRLFYWGSNAYATGDAVVGKNCPEKKPHAEQEVECVSPETYIEGLKRVAQDTAFFTKGINVFLVNPHDPSAFGVAYYPWDLPSSGSIIGSGTIVAARSNLKKGDRTLSHLLGHALGLYHVFHGNDEESTCRGCNQETNKPDCYERHPSDITGDLCSDTRPTPRIYGCNIEGVEKRRDACTGRYYDNIASNNIMSYQGDECRRNFTPQQVRRMRCWSQTGLVVKRATQAQCKNVALDRWEACDPVSIHQSSQRRSDLERANNDNGSVEPKQSENGQPEPQPTGVSTPTPASNDTSLNQANSTTANANSVEGPDAAVGSESSAIGDVSGEKGHSLQGSIPPPHESSRPPRENAAKEPSSSQKPADSNTDNSVALHGKSPGLTGAIPPPGEHGAQQSAEEAAVQAAEDEAKAGK